MIMTWNKKGYAFRAQILNGFMQLCKNNKIEVF